jgi:cytoskeletal protein CcmA (bactofilin family)
VKGRIEVSELLVLKATAVIHGDIVAGKLVVESGAVFNGTCKMGAAVKEIKIAENGAQTRTLSAQQEVKSL